MKTLPNIPTLPPAFKGLSLLALSIAMTGCKAPVSGPAAIHFTDVDTSAALGGDIVIERALAETDITLYRIRWGSEGNCLVIGDPIGDATKGTDTADLVFTLPTGTAQPEGATKILAFARNTYGENASCASVDIINEIADATASSPNVDMNNPLNYANPVLPAFYDGAVLASRNTPADNPVTDKGATLGRVLFFDKALSLDDSIACASCHIPAVGFTDPGAVSTGIFGQTGTMHAMRIANAAFYRGSSMFWDKRAPTLEAQATQPITNPVEMGFDDSNGGINALIAKMQNTTYYPALFEQVFGTSEINEDRIQRAIAQFERSIISTTSRWDQGVATTFNPALPDRGFSSPIPGFTAQENEGLRLFMLPRAQGGTGCAACHQPPTFSLAANSLSNGLDANETRIFKSPSLKTLAQDMPMMHDGRFTTLEEVVTHYNSGIAAGRALDNRLRDPDGNPLRLNLSDTQQAALVAFLKTLQDPTLANDVRFSDPFPTP